VLIDRAQTPRLTSEDGFWIQNSTSGTEVSFIPSASGDLDVFNDGTMIFNPECRFLMEIQGTSSYAISASHAITSSYSRLSVSSSVVDIGNPNTNYAIVFQDGRNLLFTNGGSTSLFSINPSTGSIKSSMLIAESNLVIPVYSGGGVPSDALTGNLKGMMAYNSSSNFMFIYDGSTWRSASFS
jgi:hypothetical protein